MDILVRRDAPICTPATAMLPDNGKDQCLGRNNEENSLFDQSKIEIQMKKVLVGDQRELAQDFKMTEAVVPPFTTPTIPPIARHHYPTNGTGILLIIPTLNAFKTKLLKETFERSTPRGHILHTISVAFDSGVGEQPYNSAGFEGVYNRITNALRHFNNSENQRVFREHQIGTVIVAAIENFIQIEGVERPTDFGAVVLHNATSGKTESCLSQGVTVPRQYFDQARQLGFEDNVNYGMVSVGKVFAENVPGIDHANWHEVVSGRSRYDILTEAVQGLQIPW